LNYLVNGFNATAAYAAAYPKATRRTARQEGYRFLTFPDVRRFIWSRLEQAWKDRQMSGDEALGRVAMDARADMRMLFDAKGEALLPHEWPDDITNSVESFERSPNGHVKFKLASKSAARRTILEQTGKLKSPLEGGMAALARAIRGDRGLQEDEDDAG
jgi:phage terminase small subunit